MAAYSARYEAALRLAARAHRAQTRKGSDIPYVTHPVHVSVILIRYGFPEDVALAGLLHDVVEDQDVPLMCIEADFGPAVAEMVASLSERKREGGLARPWQVRKQEALEQMRTASPEAVAVKAADVLHNARALACDLREAGPQVWEAFSRGPEETLWYYRAALALARERLGCHPLVDDAEDAVNALESEIRASGGAAT